MIPDAGPAGASCSRAGCSNRATIAVNWRNPKIHGPERVKVWLACDDHVEYLSGFLAARDFPVVVGDIDEPVTLPAARGEAEQ